MTRIRSTQTKQYTTNCFTKLYEDIGFLVFSNEGWLIFNIDGNILICLSNVFIKAIKFESSLKQQFYNS